LRIERQGTAKIRHRSTEITGAAIGYTDCNEDTAFFVCGVPDECEEILRSLTMTMYTRKTYAVMLYAAMAVVMAVSAAGRGDAAAKAKSIRNATGISGGLVVHVGCGNGELTAALRANDSFIVHGLDTDAANVAKAREHLAGLKLTGKVSIAQLAGKGLPYIDNLVNLVVAEDLGPIPPTEVMRVLAPNGVAYIGGKKTVKPRPKEIDEWTHFLHDASGNAVANDTVVAPPRHMQWLAAPNWSRNHHKLASISSVVSAGGRIFYIMDSGPAANMSIPGKWSLVARDAFNGVLLWRRAMASWAYQGHGFRSGPVQLPRTLVAGPGCVYAPLEMGAAVSAVDAVSGEISRTYKETARAEELILSDGVLLVVTGSPQPEQAGIDPARRGGAKFPNTKTIVAVRPKTGEVLWKWSDAEIGRLMPLTLAAADKRVFFEAGKGVVCLDIATGKQVWNSGPTGASKPVEQPKPAKGARKRKGARRGYGNQRRAGWSVATLTVSGGVVLLADGGKLQAFSATDGKGLWNGKARPGLCRSPADVLVVGGLVWQGPHFAEGRNLRTGKVEKTNTAQRDIWTVGHHHRCYRNKAAGKYILTGYRGIEFLDVFGADHTRNNWIRGTCQYGIMPANGLIYASSHACGCFMEAKLYGFWAVGPERKSSPPAARAPRLRKGPAYGENSQSATRSSTSLRTSNPQSQWPTLRHDPLRSGSTPAKLPAAVKNLWHVKVGGRLSAPVVAGGIVVVSSIDAHRIVALDAATGKQRWTFTAGGRVDSPPTIYNGLAVFGCADGWVYCLRASDGKEAWRFRAAPQDLRTVVLDQVESVWPVHGSVLVEDGVAYFAAGRSSYIDGGVRMYALDVATGKKLHESTVRTAHPKARNPAKAAAKTKIPLKKFSQNATDYKTFTDPDTSDAFSMGGTTTDVLVSDGNSIFLRQLRFDRKCVRQKKMGRHLLSTTRLLDDAENHRSHWVLGTGDFSRTPVAYSWIANRGPGGAYGAKLSVPYGLMLTYGDRTVWGVKRPGRGGGGYRVFAQANTPFSPDDPHLPDFRPAKSNTAPPQKWSTTLPLRPRAILRAGDMIFLAGMADAISAGDPHATFEGRSGGLMRTISAVDGKALAQRKLTSPPVWDGLAATAGRLYMTTMDGHIICMDRDETPPPVPAAPASPAKPTKPGRKVGDGPKGSPGKPVTADKTGRFVLTPATAKTTGRLRYSPERNNLGAWLNPADYCQWTLKGVKAGTYAVEFAYGTTRGGVAYTIVAGKAKLPGKTENTGGIRTYKAYKVGTIALPAGKVTLAVKPGRFTGAIMNYRLITLRPVK